MEREKAKEILSANGWLSRLPDAARTQILARTVLKKFSKGDVIYQLADPPGGMYGLVSGSVRVSIAPHLGGPYLAHYGRPGFWFGEAAVITGEPRRVGVVAHSELAVLHLSLPEITALIEADPLFWRHLAVTAVLSLDLAFRAYDDMKIRDPLVRVASILLRLAGYHSSPVVVDERSRIEINQTDLAEIAGLSRNVVSRVLSRLSRDGLVCPGYGYIDLPDPKRLADRISRHY
jgi:CRP/FNR family cyclic AMP-dependent transcriptional regulator